MDIKRLESWYLQNKRNLSFRETSNPYHVWVSEVMLQQTQVETVLPYFNQFILKYPTIAALAEADDDILHRDVEGLGYYRRFKNMHKAAKMMTETYNGKFPETYPEVLALPGIGKYTAGAIMSIAYNKPYSALDGNVVRVLSRFLGNDLDMREEKNKKILDIYNQAQIEKGTPHIYTQAMMELGATICRPKQPKCEQCPLRNDCFAYNHQQTHLFPVLSKLKEQRIESYITLVIHQGNGIYLRKRTESLLNGMYEYPQFESESITSVLEQLESEGIRIDHFNEPQTYKHVFSHIIWMMHVYHVILIGKPNQDWIFVDKDQINQLPMAVAHRKIRCN